MPFDIIGESAAMVKLKHSIRNLATTSLPILLLGETGTGKELVARAIHDANPRRGPLVVVDCSALVDNLTESELFGHKKGAFTGAITERSGLIDAASGGTAFFDEIGELPVRLQAKLLRLLQEKEYRPVGGSNYRSADFRVIAATNRDLREAVRGGTFREDLYYRISAITLQLPPLRARKADIPLLLKHFLQQYPMARGLSTDVVDSLMSYSWRGNVRQLEHCARCMVEINACRLLGTGDLECPISEALLSCESASSPDTRTSEGPETRCLAELEREAIVRALRRAGGQIGKAASALGIGRTTLYRRLKQYRIADCWPDRDAVPAHAAARQAEFFHRADHASPNTGWRMCSR